MPHIATIYVGKYVVAVAGVVGIDIGGGIVTAIAILLPWLFTYNDVGYPALQQRKHY